MHGTWEEERTSVRQESDGWSETRRSLSLLTLGYDAGDVERILEILRSSGFDVDCTRATNETEFLRYLPGRPELILADYLVPGYDALRALQAVRDRGLDIPFVIVSNAIGEEVAVEAMKAGAADCLSKDLLGRLGVCVERALRRQRQAEQLREAERALRESEERLRAVAESCTDAVYQWDLDSGEVRNFATPRKSLGYAEGELPDTYAGWEAIIHPADRERVTARVRKSIAGAVPFEAEYRVVAKDGSIRHWSDRARILPGSRKWIGATNDITGRVEVQERVGAMNAALLDLSAKLLRGQDEERRRFARQLHDSTAQSLTAISLSLTLLGMTPGIENLPEAQKTLQECNAMVESSIREVRTMSYSLHPPLLDDLGLEAAVRHFLPQFEARCGMRVEFHGAIGERRFPPHIETLAFRFLQEALSNVERHAQASSVRVRIAASGGGLTVAVQDNGHGFTPHSAGREPGEALYRVGLASIRERARLIRGDIQVASTPAGALVEFAVPIPAE